MAKSYLTIGKWNLIYETFSKINNGNGVEGTIRTLPSSYYVGTVSGSGKLTFEGIEGQTRDSINKEKIRKAFENKQIPMIQNYHE